MVMVTVTYGYTCISATRKRMLTIRFSAGTLIPSRHLSRTNGGMKRMSGSIRSVPAAPSGRLSNRLSKRDFSISSPWPFQVMRLRNDWPVPLGFAWTCKSDLNIMLSMGSMGLLSRFQRGRNDLCTLECPCTGLCAPVRGGMQRGGGGVHLLHPRQPDT